MREHPDFSTGSHQMTRGKEYHYFIEVMMKALIPLKKITSKQLDRAYAMTFDDLSYELEPEGKKNLFQFMLKIKRILEVEKSTAMHRYDLVAIDQNDNTCIVDWKTGQKYPKDIEQVSQYVHECEGIKVGYLIYLDLNEQIEILRKEPDQKVKCSVSNENEEAKSSQEDSKSDHIRPSPKEEEKLSQKTDIDIDDKQKSRKLAEILQSSENIPNQYRSLLDFEELLSTSRRRSEVSIEIKKRARSSKSECRGFNFTENGNIRNSHRKKLRRNIQQPRKK